MPSQLEPALEERFGELLAQVRATRVEPSRELWERVRGLEPAPRRQLFRRRTLALAFAAALVVGAVAVGIAQRGGNDQRATVQAERGAAVGGAGAVTDSSTKEFAAPTQSARLQDFRADLTVRVDDPEDLPDATRRAMQIAQSLGGYVVSAQYGGGDTDSVMTLRVPIGNAQEAISRLTGLGRAGRAALLAAGPPVDGRPARRAGRPAAGAHRRARGPAAQPAARAPRAGEHPRRARADSARAGRDRGPARRHRGAGAHGGDHADADGRPGRPCRPRASSTARWTPSRTSGSGCWRC